MTTRQPIKTQGIQIGNRPAIIPSSKGNQMQDIRDLYECSMDLLQNCNEVLSGDAQLQTINTKLAGVVKDLNDIMIKELTGKITDQAK
jgi:hypothetical protein